jgi:sarcosine oxidase subunit beta
MKKKTDVVIIGGGCIGAATAYELAKRGVRDVVLVERGTLSCGATGRCAGGARQQWSEPANVRLAKASIEMFKRFEDEMGRDIGLVNGGYLLCAHSPEEAERFRKNVKMQRENGADVRIVDPHEIHEIAPYLNTDGMALGAYCPDDLHADPFLAVQGWAENAMRLGVDVELYTEVTGFKKKGNRVTTVATSRGDIECKTVVNAAGPWSQDVGRMLGIELGTFPERHQIAVSEPVKRMLWPLVVDFYVSIYFRQAAHGSFLFGHSDPNEKPSYNIRGTWRFLEEISKKLTTLMPALKNINIVRQWAGLYDMSPDAQPIMGKVSDGAENFLVAIGYSGHGFMLAPMTGLLMAELIIHGETRTQPIDALSIKRFEGGKKGVEKNVV